MYKINIIKSNVVTNSVQFATQALCLDFLNTRSSNGSFGKILREVRPMYSSTEYPEDISNHISQRVEQVNESDVIVYTLPADFTYEILDITAEYQAQQESQHAMLFLAHSDYKVLRHIRQQALSLLTTLTQAQYLDLEQQRHDASLKVL